MTETIEKHKFKITVATALLVIVFIISTSIQTATWKANMESEHIQCKARATMAEDQLQANKNRIIALEGYREDSKVQLATINTKLANIETLLIEIKLDIKNK